MKWRKHFGLIVALALVQLISLIGGCATARMHSADPPAPPGYVEKGQCSELGIDARTGKPSMLRCVAKDGEVIIWTHPEEERKK